MLTDARLARIIDIIDKEGVRTGKVLTPVRPPHPPTLPTTTSARAQSTAHVGFPNPLLRHHVHREQTMAQDAVYTHMGELNKEQHQAIVHDIYMLWKSKRNKLKKAVIRQYWPPTDVNDTNPHHVFRPREKVLTHSLKATWRPYHTHLANQLTLPAPCPRHTTQPAGALPPAQAS